MRYWLHRDGALQGPLEPSDIAAFPEVDEHTLLCPEAKPPRDRKNWRFLRAFPDAAAAVAARTDARVARREQASARAAAQAPPDPKPPRARWPIAAALAAGLAATAAFLGRPAPSPQAPSRPKAAELEPWERAARQRVPGCGRSLMDVAGGPPSVSAQGGTRVRLGWGAAVVSNEPSGLAFEYDQAGRALHPLTRAARRVMDNRQGCDPKSR